MLKSRGWTWRQIDVQIDLIDAIVLVGRTKRLFPTKILKSKGPSFITRITPTSVQHTHIHQPLASVLVCPTTTV